MHQFWQGVFAVSRQIIYITQIWYIEGVSKKYGVRGGGGCPGATGRIARHASSAVHSQKTVGTYLISKRVQPFGLSRQSRCRLGAQTAPRNPLYSREIKYWMEHSRKFTASDTRIMSQRMLVANPAYAKQTAASHVSGPEFSASQVYLGLSIREAYLRFLVTRVSPEVHPCRPLWLALSRRVQRHFQQTRDNHPMLVQCWASVADGGPTLYQHRVNVSCLLGFYTLCGGGTRVAQSTSREYYYSRPHASCCYIGLFIALWHR